MDPRWQSVLIVMASFFGSFMLLTGALLALLKFLRFDFGAEIEVDDQPQR